VHLARLLGPVTRLDEAEVASLHDRYTHVYGQQGRPAAGGDAR
jgi:hypothetical protein